MGRSMQLTCFIWIVLPTNRPGKALLAGSILSWTHGLRLSSALVDC
jgi:hypothetical protein